MNTSELAEGVSAPTATKQSLITQPPKNTFSPFTLYLSDQKQGITNNTDFKNKTEITGLSGLACACLYDHTSNHFKDFKRSNNNYIQNNVFIMDIDNSHTDDPSKWIYPEQLDDQLPLKEIEYVIVPSRNNRKIKHPGEPSEQSARPRFHVYFSTRQTIKDKKTYQLVMLQFLHLFNKDAEIFDKAVKDPGRQIFGSPSLTPTDTDLIHHPGDKTILDYLSDHQEELKDIKVNTHGTVDLSDMSPIKENRHNELVKIRLACFKRYGDTEQGKAVFEKHVLRCVKPYDTPEERRDLARIELDAKKEWEKEILTDPDYIPPDRFNRFDKNVYLETVEQELQEMGVSVRDNVITKRMDISKSYLIRQGNSNKDPETFLVTDLMDRFRRKGLKCNKDHLYDILATLSDRNRFNRFEEFILSEPWDQIPRIDILIDILNLDDPNKRELVKKWLIQAVFIILNGDYNPQGNEFVLVLKGKQGLGKTSFFRSLFPQEVGQMFAEGVKIDMENKDTLIQATSIECCELGELEATFKKDQADLKAFITRNYDTIRHPYGRNEIITPRRTVYCATVNPDSWLRDEEGGRRWVVIEVDNIDKVKLGADKDRDPEKKNCLVTPEFAQQIWAEVYETYYKPEKSYAFRLSQEELENVMNDNLKYLPTLPGIDEITTYFDWEGSGEWIRMTPSEVRDKLGMKGIGLKPEQIGRALNRLSKIKGYERINPEKTRTGRYYMIPPLKDI